MATLARSRDRWQLVAIAGGMGRLDRSIVLCHPLCDILVNLSEAASTRFRSYLTGKRSYQQVTSKGRHCPPSLEWFRQPHPEPKPVPKERPDGMKLARHYQALLDSSKFEDRAALARHLGVSRVQVTQMLRR